MIPLIAALIMGVVVFGMYHLMTKFMSMRIALLVGIVVGALVYFVLLIKLKGVRENEIRSFPGGDFLARLAINMHLL